ncbi:MAG: phage holin family protein [Lachnospiraceae bacterium]|nr:phage holin family protein [Lachnospiraceae bacterium]
MEKVKVTVIAAVSALMGWLGILAVPVLLLVLCNVIDYGTGIVAAKYRTEEITSYKGMKGIVKKVCMWLLIVLGAVIDTMLNYAVEYIGLSITLPFIVATVVAVWLLVNEIISILENMIDIGVDMPPFLMPLVKNIKKQVEDKASVAEENTEDTEDE